jgi:hypothetical protein
MKPEADSFSNILVIFVTKIDEPLYDFPQYDPLHAESCDETGS